MKKHNLLKVLLIVLLLVVLGSWFLPVVTVQDGAFQTATNSTKIGLFNLASYIGIVLQVFGPVIVFVLSIGGLYGVLYKVPQYRVLLDKIVKGFEGKEAIFMIIVGVIFAALSSMAGLSIVLLLFFPFVISVILLMGYDKITAIMLTVGSVIAGLIGSVFSANDVNALSIVFQQKSIENADKLASMDALWKIALLVLSLALVLVNTILYAKKHRTKKVDLGESILVPKKEKVKGKGVLPIVLILDSLLVVLTLAFISWGLLGVDVFKTITTGFVNPTGSTFVKGLYGGINTVLGLTVDNAFGTWTILEAALVVFLAAGLIALVYRVKFNGFVSSLEEGIKKALRPALLVALAYMVLVCIVTVPFEFSILQHIINLNSGFNLLIMIIVAFVFCFFTVESYYGVVTAASYLMADTVLTGNFGIIALTWQAVYGLTMLVAPTSVILLATLAYTDVSYTSWIKAVWKLFLELLALIIVVLLLFNGLA